MMASHSSQLAGDSPAPTASTPQRGHRALRAYRVSIAHRTYFLTACAHRREPLFASPVVAGLLFDQLHRLETDDHAIELIAMVVMPDHLHALVRLTEDSELPNVMHRFRGATSQLINRHWHRTGTVWQRGYFERRLRLDESLAAILQYMWNNPTPPGAGFRCRRDTWEWFRMCIGDPHDHPAWLRDHVANKFAPT